MKSSFWLSAGLCALCQCTGTETGNPVHGEDIQVAFAPLKATVVRRGLGEVSFDRVAIRVASVSLEPCDERQQSTVLFQNRSVDLFGDELREARVPAGTYCAMIVGMGSDTDSFAAGRMVNGGRTTLTFESQLRAPARLEFLEPLIASGARPSFILSVDLAEWLGAIGAWLDSGDSQLTLDDPETLALRQAQARSLRLFADADDDGELDVIDVDRPLSKVGVLLR